MTKRVTRNRRQKRRIARTRKMVGGAFTQTQLQQLQPAQFTENQIQSIEEMGVPFDEVLFRVNQLRNQVPDDELSEHVMVEILNEQIFDAIPHAQNDVHEMDLSITSDNGSLHMSDLDVSEDSMRANTTSASESIGNSQMSNGGKRYRIKTSKKGRKSEKNRKSRKSRKQRGGTCYGNGVGANSYDPNDSIYNTNMLKLFPYKPQ